jgi:hypothetical protein
MRERCAKQRHDAIAHHLVDRALEAMHRVHHPLEHWIEDLTRLLGIAVGEQLHRAFEVSKQHCDLFALAFEGRLGGENLLGEVHGRIVLGGGETRLPQFNTRGVAALGAKRRRRRKLGPTACAG